MSFQLLLAKTEVTPGTDSVPVAANAVYAEGVSFMPKGERVTLDPAKPSTTANPGVIVGIHSEISFDVPLSSSGSPGVAPAWGALMKACGYSETIVATTSVTYAPLADLALTPALTKVWRDSLRNHKMLMCRGKVGLKISAKQIPRLSFTFRGIHVPLAVGAALVPADGTFTPWTDVLPVAQGRSTFSLGGVAMQLLELSADTADNIKFYDLTGQKGVFLKGDRNMSSKIKAWQPAVGTYSPEAKWIAGAKEQFAFVHNTTAGQIITVNGRQQLGTPSWSRVDETDTFESGGFLVGSDIAANDDFSIVLT